VINTCRIFIDALKNEYYNLNDLCHHLLFAIGHAKEKIGIKEGKNYG